MIDREQDNIDLYLLGQMSSEEFVRFEKKIQTNDTLAQEVMAQREAIALTKAMGDKIIRARIEKAEKIALTKTANYPRQFKKVAIALSLLLILISAFLYYWKTTQEVDPMKIYANHYQPYALSFGDRGEENVLRTASIAYGDKKYSEALQLLEEVGDTGEGAKVALTKGICLMEMEQFEKAIRVFSTFIDDPMYGEQCQWYSALSFLYTGQIDQATIQFQKIVQTADGFQQNAAQKILTQLSKKTIQ